MDPNQNNQQPGKGRQSILILLICILVSLLCMSFFSGMFGSTASKQISYDAFLLMLENKELQEVEINGTTLNIKPKTAGDIKEPVVNYYTTMTEDETAWDFVEEETEDEEGAPAEDEEAEDAEDGGLDSWCIPQYKRIP